MTADDESAAYREIIDRLVHSCLRGQGQVARRNVIAGVWHRYVEDIVGPDTPDWMLESSVEWATKMRAANELLAQLSAGERETLAWMLDEQYAGGVHEALVVLHEAEIAPFDVAYEGAPFNDFVARLDDWQWPADQART